MTRLLVLSSLTVGSIVAGTLAFNCLKPVDPMSAGVDSIKAHRAVPPEVTTILARSCTDCHSSHTRWPWYTHLPVVDKFTHKNAERGRKEFDLSNWTAKMAQGSDEEIGTLNGMCEEARAKAMPLPVYVLMHPTARLSAPEIDTLCKWSGSTVATASASAERHP